MVLDIREPSKTEQQGDIAWPLVEQGLKCQEIAERLGVSIQRVTAIMKAAGAKRGIASVDGRLREAAWAGKPKRSDDAREEVLRLWHEGLLIDDIAKRVNLNRNVIRRVMAIWYEEQGLTMPDGRRRRMTLPVKGHRASDVKSVEHERDISEPVV